MAHFIEIKEHIYWDLTLEFLSRLHIEVTRGSQCQAGYILFYLQGQLYELNQGTLNSIFDFSISMDLPNLQAPYKFNPNAFWGKFSVSVRYSTSSSKCTHIRNPCIRVAQRILACCFFAQDGSLNVSRLPELYFWSCMLDVIQFNLSSFLANQLYSATVSTKGRVAICDIVTTIVRFLGIQPNPDDRVSWCEWLDQAAFEIMRFCKVEAGRLCWVTLGIGFYRFPTSIELPYFIGLTFIEYLVMPRLFDLHPTLHPLILVKPDLALPLNHHLLTMPTYKPPFGLFRRSKCPFKLMLLLRTPLFVTLSKSTTMSSVRCLLP